jgi:hypothetical protein
VSAGPTTKPVMAPFGAQLSSTLQPKNQSLSTPQRPIPASSPNCRWRMPRLRRASGIPTPSITW